MYLIRCVQCNSGGRATALLAILPTIFAQHVARQSHGGHSNYYGCVFKLHAACVMVPVDSSMGVMDSRFWLFIGSSSSPLLVCQNLSRCGVYRAIPVIIVPSFHPIKRRHHTQVSLVNFSTR